MTAALGRWRATYTPGEWVVLCGPTSLVLLEPPTHEWASLINTLWDEVVASRSIVDLAARLADFPIGELPSFGAFFWTEDGMRSLIRGQVSVIDLATGKVVANGHGIQTWSEVGLAGVDHIRVEVPHEEDATLLELPLVVGAVRASSVVLDASEQAQVSSPQGQQVPGEAPGDRSGPTTEPLPEVDAAPSLQPAQPGSGTDGLDRIAGAVDAPISQTAELAATELAAFQNAETELLLSPFDEPESDTEPDTEPSAGPDAVSDASEPDASEPDVSEPDVSEPQRLEAAVAPNLAEDRAGELSARPGPSSASSPDVEESAIIAVLCPNGHASPPNSTSCRVCGSPVGTQGPQFVAHPVLAVLRASNGISAEVDRPVLIGRAPSSNRSSSLAPRLMTVPSPNHDISRTHVEVAPDDWQIVVTDLNSTNGTLLVRPGGADRHQLAPGEPVAVQVGSVMELGDGVSVLIDFPQ